MPNKFDRILKENFREPTIWLFRKMVGVKSVKVLPLPRKMQRTLERETDLLLLITPIKGLRFIANIEWQTTNDPRMPRRMLLYHAMAYILHGIPVRGYVIYIGEDKMNMPNQLCHESLNYSFTLIDLTDLSPEEFLSSDVPEEVMLAILAGKSRGEEKRSVIQKVLSKLRLLLKEDEATLSRRLTQLEILGELRSIQQLIIKEEQTMALTYNLEKDIRYRQGLEAGVEKGIEKKTRNFIQSLLIKTKLSLQEIADIAGVSVDFVKTIKKQ